VAPIRRLSFNGLQGVMSHKMELFHNHRCENPTMSVFIDLNKCHDQVNGNRKSCYYMLIYTGIVCARHQQRRFSELIIMWTNYEGTFSKLLRFPTFFSVIIAEEASVLVI
jgi:hypothetical protein